MTHEAGEPSNGERKAVDDIAPGIERSVQLFMSDLAYGEPARSGMIPTETVKNFLENLAVLGGSKPGMSADEFVREVMASQALLRAQIVDREQVIEELHADLELSGHGVHVIYLPDMDIPEPEPYKNRELTVSIPTHFRNEITELLTRAARAIDNEDFENNTLITEIIQAGIALHGLPAFFSTPPLPNTPSKDGTYLEAPQQWYLYSPEAFHELIGLLQTHGQALIRTAASQELGQQAFKVAAMLASINPELASRVRNIKTISEVPKNT